MVQTISVSRDGKFSVDWGDVCCVATIEDPMETPERVVVYLRQIVRILQETNRKEVHVEVNDPVSFTHLINNDGSVIECGPFDYISRETFEIIMAEPPVNETEAPSETGPMEYSEGPVI